MSEYQPIKKTSFGFLIATVFGLGKIPFAPGTIGSIVGAIDFCLIILLSGKINFYILGGWCLLSWYAIELYCSYTKQHDPKEVIIDEVVGQELALYLTYFIIGGMYPDLVSDADGYILNPFIIVASFILFRFFDISKISLVGYLDRMNTNLSILLDDLAAGIFAAISLTALTHILYLFFIG